jgi:zinc protease
VFSKEDLDEVLAEEADRFQRLKYAEPAYKTESLAVLGEYNKKQFGAAAQVE